MTFDFSKKLFVSTIAEDCAAAAREHSLGLEIAEFCYAPNMDTDSAAHFRRVSQLTAESGPDHDKHFVVAVRFNSDRVARGEGRSKKAAEQHAAKEALKLLGVIKEK